jgi:hypothetical protein
LPRFAKIEFGLHLGDCHEPQKHEEKITHNEQIGLIHNFCVYAEWSIVKLANLGTRN